MDMTGNGELSLLDRSTLLAWRATNLIGWGTVALGLTVFATWLRNRLGFPYHYFAIGPSPFLFRPALTYALTAAAIIGVVLGLKAFRYAGGAAAAVAGLYAILSIFAVPGQGSGLIEVFVSPGFFVDRPARGLVAVLEIIVAFGIAELVWRLRPKALRGGRTAE